MTLARVYPESVGTFNLDGGHRYTIGPDACRVGVNLALREPWIAVDIETAGLGELGMDIKCVTIGTKDHAVILDPRDDRQRDAICEALHFAKCLVFHNAAYDVPYLVRNGLMCDLCIDKVEDTLIYARFAEPDETVSKGLDGCAKRYLGSDGSAGVLTRAFRAAGFNKAEGFRAFDLDRMIYVFGAADDVLTTAALYPILTLEAIRRLQQHPFGDRGVTGPELVRVLKREQTLNHIFIKRSCKGYRVDYEFLDRYRRDNQATIDADWAQLTAADVTTPAKLISYLEDNDAIPFGYPTTPKGKLSTAAKSLLLLDNEMATTYKRHKDLVKVDRDYLQKCVDLSSLDGRVHPQTNILGAKTGRSSMGNPPMQQFPEAARGIILAEPGDSMVSIDWAQIEPVVIANIAHDFDMVDFYESGGDFYEGVGTAGGITRKHAKTTLLAQLYGQGHALMCSNLGVDDKTGYAIRDAVFGPLPRVENLVKRTKVIGDVHNLIFTLSGRMVPVHERATYTATNYLVQGSAYDLLAEALLALHEAGLSDGVYWGMHDEIVCSQDISGDVRKIMETPPDRLIEAAGRVPVLRTDLAVLGERWAAT